MSMYREEIADLTMEDIALAIAMESLEDIDGWVAKKSSTSVEAEKLLHQDLEQTEPAGQRGYGH